MQAMGDTTTGKAVAPGDVLASSDCASAQSRTILRPPTSEQAEQRNRNRRQPKKKKPDNLTIEISKEKKEEEKMKQPSLKEFLQFTKMKNDNKETEKIGEEEFSEKKPRRYIKRSHHHGGVLWHLPYERINPFCHQGK